MTPTIPHVLMTVHGSLPGGETWSCGIRTLAWATTLGETVGGALAIAVSNRFRVLSNDTKGALLFGNLSTSPNLAAIDGTTVRRLNEDGITVEQYEGSPTTALVPVAVSATPYPNQCALVATLTTARAGRTGKGRIYLPCMANLGLTGGRIPLATTALLATAVKTCLDGMNTDVHTALDASNAIAVQSSKASAEPGVWTVGAPAGYMGAAIVSVRIGDTIDTQRRRRSSIAENYSTAQLA